MLINLSSHILFWELILTINYNFYLKLLTFYLLIVSKIVKFRYGVVLKDLKYGHAE